MNKPKAAAHEVVRVIHEAPRMAEVQTSIEAEVERQVDRRLNLLQQDLDWQFAQQDEALNLLSAEFAQRSLDALRVEPRRRRGGVPWTLLLLGGAGYVLWRQPQVRQRVTGVFQQLSGQFGPQVRDTVQRAEQAVRQRLGQVQSQTGPQAGASAASSVHDDVAQKPQTVVTLGQDPLQSVGETQGSPMSNGGQTSGSAQATQDSTPAGQNLDGQVNGPGTAGLSPTGSQKKPNTRR